MKIVAYICRLLLGAVFIFSGFVKAVDPLGSAYKFHDYFGAFNVQWLDSSALLLSIFLSALEFVIGMALFFGVLNRLAAWGGLLFMGFFTPLTLYLAIANPVSDCGCFGDAIIMTNWQTFYKNLIFMVFAIITFIYRNRFKKLFCCKVEILIVFFFMLISVGFSVYGLRNLPVLDFRPWKVGNSMKMDTETDDRYYLIYRHIETGELSEYLSPDFPWDDSLWMATNEFVDQRIEAAPLPETYLYMGDENGHDYFKAFTQHSDFQFILFMYDVETANLRNMKAIKLLAEKSMENGIDFVGLTSSLPEKAHDFIKKHNLAFEFFFSDAITLKTVIRSNPGLMLIQDGVILKKWSHRNIPEFESVRFEELSDKYVKKE